MRAPPHKGETRTVATTEWTSVLHLRGAVLGRAYAIRIKGVSLNWRVVAVGLCGRETLASGTIGASPSGPTRVTGLPETIGADALVVEVQVTSTPTVVVAEASWIPTVYGPRGGPLLMDADGVVVEG